MSEGASQSGRGGDGPRGRGRGRGRGSSGGRSGGRGRRGGRATGRENAVRDGGGNTNSASGAPGASADKASHGGAARSARAIMPKQQTPAATAEVEDDDADVCFICANPVAYHSVAPCNHATCHICGLRMRALYKTKDCAHCR
ncbi:hypothetical protein E4U54_006390, partial [Claviceps lovelessii]